MFLQEFMPEYMTPRDKEILMKKHMFDLNESILNLWYKIFEADQVEIPVICKQCLDASKPVVPIRIKSIR
jgi:hypothetical protein